VLTAKAATHVISKPVTSGEKSACRQCTADFSLRFEMTVILRTLLFGAFLRHVKRKLVWQSNHKHWRGVPSSLMPEWEVVACAKIVI